MKDLIRTIIVLFITTALCTSCRATLTEPESFPSEPSEISSIHEIEFPQSSEPSKKDFQNLQDIVEEISAQLKENEIAKDVKTFFVPELFVNAEDQFTKMNPRVENDEANGRVFLFFNQYNDPALSVGKYEIFISQITYFEQPQDTSVIERVQKEMGKDWHTYTFEDKNFAFACLKNSDDGTFLFNFEYYINETTHIYIAAAPKDNKNIDTEEKAIAVFKDFQCKTIQEVLQ